MPIRALVFDVFGTLVDWRSGVAREVERLLGNDHPGLDGGSVADAWRARYQPSMEEIRAGRRAWADLDTLHGESLDDVLGQFGLSVSPGVRYELVLAWHRLDAWPEVPGALTRLRERFLLAPLSNGHVALMIALARRNRIAWDAILGAEFARDYKPKPEVYLRAVQALGCRPADVLMVACHSSDLAAAAACGLSTAHVARPDEHGPGRGEIKPEAPVDFIAADLSDLARQLNA
ncbi:haloacid dehalogenase type II [Microvirga massiliensis]|uniref:haloacid dehalogenase type II n=1 Tax=Microvirga massiliensis TaxID=1033741 RepID=UPI00062BAC41|nr:haloacid dehalogenase type II [Microvirga massiliensis]